MTKSKNKTFIVRDIEDDKYQYIDEVSVKTKLDAIKFYIKDAYGDLEDSTAYGTYQAYEVSSWEEYEYGVKSPKPEFTKFNNG